MDQEKELSSGEPEIYAIEQGQSGWQFNRREFLALSGMTAAALAVSGCSEKKEGEQISCTGLYAHSDEVNRLYFSPDNSLLVSMDDKDGIKIWSVPDGQLVGKIEDSNRGKINKIEFLPDGSLITQRGSYTIQIWSMPDLRLIKEMEKPGTRHRNVELSLNRNGNFLFGIGGGNILHIWQINNGKLLVKQELEIGEDVEYMVSSDGYKLLISDDTDTAYLFSFDGKSEVKLITRMESDYNMTLSPDGKFVALRNDKTVKLYSDEEGEIFQTINEHEDWVRDIAFSPDSEWLITQDENSLKIWQMPECKLHKTIDLEKVEGKFHSFSPQGQWMIMRSYDSGNIFHFHDLPSGKLKRKLQFRAEDRMAINQEETLVAIANKGNIMLVSLLSEGVLACLVDFESIPADLEVVSYDDTDDEGNTFSRTVPCGSPIPPGAICTCNCVSGGGCTCVGHSTCSCVGYKSTYYYPN